MWRTPSGRRGSELLGLNIETTSSTTTTMTINVTESSFPSSSFDRRRTGHDVRDEEVRRIYDHAGSRSLPPDGWTDGRTTGMCTHSILSLAPKFPPSYPDRLSAVDLDQQRR
ncbi:hypothetical protein Mp_3g08170 [Marchantia polymorpha subsp. ruderalis]|uniref:Uncharacterized protein n=2 Tax=Marchantia polymorpha TaxID=3197 RepID=A0AAF6AYL5_MARPO|nr:hypothetical protein MARPO_0006s0291 [Marchantia polymorpha]BBN04849.1 hypothetical protein Mp_3g08170 [Marchantia polymorpha subsp. ruderalis]|eukprot:PTQ48300.1 hypothetical protein MARPO_0006s0291 [Marchantia polymorpha]